MHLGAGAVDLVEEEHREVGALLQQWARVDARLAVLAEMGVVDEVRRHQVDGALDTLEGTTYGARHGTQQGGLADADIAFQQHMAAREGGYGEQADDPLLSQHHLADLLLEAQGAARASPPGWNQTRERRASRSAFTGRGQAGLFRAPKKARPPRAVRPDPRRPRQSPTDRAVARRIA